MVNFHFFPDAETLACAAAALVADLGRNAVMERGQFSIALSGGSTPKRLFELLASAPLCTENFWTNTVVFWGDDRAVGPTHEYSNFRLAETTLLRQLPIPAENVFRIKGETGAYEAARTMLADLEQIFGVETLPCFDLVLQGVGTDGHTASLFPGTDSLVSQEWVVPVIDPLADPKVDRVTLTFPVLNAARTALFLAAGTSKQPVMQAVMNDPRAGDLYPAALVEAEQTIWLMDEAAAGLNI